MKLRFVICLLAVCASFDGVGQGRTSGSRVRYEVQPNGDTVPLITLPPVYVFAKRADWSRYNRLIRNVKKVYPIAREANRKLQELEKHLETVPNKRSQEAYVKKMEKELIAEYTPVLKRMTFSQGKILIKLIDRETSKTSYQLVRDLRGRFSAFFWQGIAKLFGANLKDTYDKDGDDQLIEHIIQLYEAGLI